MGAGSFSSFLQRKDIVISFQRYAIDALKTRVPIWKKEVWADGSAWIEGTPPAPLTPPLGGDDAS